MIKGQPQYVEVQSRVTNICVTPPEGFWRWTKLRKEIERYIESTDLTASVDMFTLFGGYDPINQRINRVETDLPYINGSFGIIVEDENNSVDEEDIDSLVHRVEHMCWYLDAEPTMEEKDTFIINYFEQFGYCDDCGGDARHHGAAYKPGVRFSEDGNHWDIFCRHQVTADGYHTDETLAIRDARTARLQRGERFLEG